MIVKNLDDLKLLAPLLIQLGYSHFSWGVREQFFEVNLIITDRRLKG